MTSLKIGEKAPEFAIKDQNGKEITLSELKGKKIILYFYPKDNTPGCTEESCNLRDNYPDFQKKGYKIFGISCDNETSHQKFIKKYKLPFDLLADTEKKMVNDYGVYGEKTFWGRKYMGIYRTTFIIDENSIIEDIISDVKTKTHTDQILKSA